VDKSSLEGLDPSKELTIKIQGTSIKHFPRGFFAKFAEGGLTLDLSNNLVESFGPEIFYTEPAHWKLFGTKPISGKLNNSLLNPRGVR
jgi:hypothetical protein